MKNGLQLAITTGFGLGLSPIMPGTLGALVGFGWRMVAFALGWDSSGTRLWCLAGIVLFVGLHYRLTPWAQRYWNESDPKHYVLDEIPGYLMVPMLAVAPCRAEWMVAGFVVERIFDIIKLPGARYFDRRVHTPTGVLMDDIIAGLYAASVISFAAFLLEN